MGDIAQLPVNSFRLSLGFILGKVSMGDIAQLPVNFYAGVKVCPYIVSMGDIAQLPVNNKPKVGWLLLC